MCPTLFVQVLSRESVSQSHLTMVAEGTLYGPRV